MHGWLAIATALAVVSVALEAAWRTARNAPPGRLANRLRTLFLIVLLMAAAGGLGVLMGGGTPREPLHFIYAILALGVLPVAESLAPRASPRRHGLITIVAAIVTAIVVWRLFRT